MALSSAGLNSCGRSPHWGRTSLTSCCVLLRRSGEGTVTPRIRHGSRSWSFVQKEHVEGQDDGQLQWLVFSLDDVYAIGVALVGAPAARDIDDHPVAAHEIVFVLSETADEVQLVGRANRQLGAFYREVA